MNARLFCKTGALAGSEYQLGEEATIGRREQNDITLPHDAVSERHARIFFDDEANCYMLEDLDSSNGTRVDATEVVEPFRLEDLHVITFAQTVDFIFQAVEEEVAAAATEEEANTHFGLAPESPSGLSGEDEPEGEKTRVGGAPGELPELPDEDSAEEDRTRFGESPPELPDFSEESKSDEPDGDRTQMGQAPDALPDLPDEDSPEQEENAAEEEARTRFGESPPELPDLSDEDASEEDSEGERTRMGDAPGALPDLPEEESSVEDEEEAAGDEDHTRFGESPPELPDLSEEPSDERDGEGAEHTQRGADAPPLPDLSEDDSSSEKDDRETGDKAPSPGAQSPEYTLQVTVEGNPEDTHPLPEGELTIGRSSDCDIQIEDPGVSRQHARLVVGADEIVLEDMGSKNFTFVDGDRLSGPTTLSPGSEIQLGLQVKAVLHRTSS